MMLGLWMWIGSMLFSSTDMHVVWILGADNDLYPQARALIDSLQSESWPTTWRFTLWLDGPGGKDTVYFYQNGLWQHVQRDEWSPGDPVYLRNILIHAVANTPSGMPLIVVLWGHGNGWYREGPQGWGLDQHPGDALEWVNGEARLAFQGLPRKVDVVLFDACTMAQVEVYGALCGAVEHVGASPALMPAEGLPWIAVLREARDERLAAGQWLQKLVLAYVRQHPQQPVLYGYVSCHAFLHTSEEMTALLGSPLEAFGRGERFSRDVRSLPGYAFTHPGLDSLATVVDADTLLARLGFFPYHYHLWRSVSWGWWGTRSTYGSLMGPAIWRPSSQAVLSAHYADYLRLAKDNVLLQRWLAVLQGVWAPDTLPPLWLDPSLRTEVQGSRWWITWASALDGVEVGSYTVRVYRYSEMGRSLEEARGQGLQALGTAHWIAEGLQFVDGSMATMPLRSCVSGEGELWVRTRWRLRTGQGDTLWIGNHPHPLDQSRVPHQPVMVDSFPCMDTLRMLARFQPGRYAILDTMAWFVGTPVQENRTAVPALSLPHPVPEAGHFLVWVVAEDWQGNRSVPLWSAVSRTRMQVVRWHQGRWEYWVPSAGVRIRILDASGRQQRSWLSPDSGWFPLPPGKGTGIRLLYWERGQQRGWGRWVRP